MKRMPKSPTSGEPYLFIEEGDTKEQVLAEFHWTPDGRHHPTADSLVAEVWFPGEQEPRETTTLADIEEFFERRR